MFKLFGYLVALVTVLVLSGQHTLFENVACILGLLSGVGFSPILGATYTPTQLISTKAFGNGSGNISTWRKQDTVNVNVHRTLVANTPTAARTITIQQGATAADTTAQRLLDAYALTANVPFILNWWVVAPVNDYFEGFANNTDIDGASHGYSFA